MYTQVSGLTKTRRLLLPVLALIVTGLLLTTWFTYVSANTSKLYVQYLYNSTILGNEQDAQQSNEKVYQKEHETNRNLFVGNSLVTNTFILDIEKSSSNITFSVGSADYYNILVRRVNTETVDSSIRVRDTLPDGMTWTPLTTIGEWNCSTSNPSLVNCTYSKQIPAGSLLIEPLRFNVNVASDISRDVVTNTAYLYIGSDEIPDDYSYVRTYISSADLELKKKQSPTSVFSTTVPISYTMVITNNGPTIARNVILTETLPDYLQPFTAYVATKGNYSLIDNKWTVGDLIKGEEVTLTLFTKPTSTSSGRQITNVARVSSKTSDWNIGNNSSSTSFVVGGMDIEKSVSVPSNSYIFAGEIFTYTITVTNTRAKGDVAANVRDILTSTLETTSCNLYFIDSNGIISSMTPCYFSGNILNTFPIIPAKNKAVFIIGVRGNKEIGDTPRTITNTASVTWGSPSFTLESNEVETLIAPGGFVGVSKQDGFSTVSSGQSLSYTIVISNVGSRPLKSDSIKVTDTLQANLEFISINKNGLTMNPIVQTSSVRSWEILQKELTAGEKLSFIIGVRVPSNPVGFQTRNKVEVSARNIDNRESKAIYEDINNLTYSSNTLISIKKSVTPEQAKVGETFTFQLVLNNNGDSAANNIIVNDYFPDAVDLVSATTSRGTATLSTTTREVEVRIPTMNPDEKTTIVISARVNSTVTTAKTYRNRAYIKWTGVSEFNSNNVAFRVLPSGTLPGTGTVGRQDLQGAAASPFLAVGGLLLLAALALLAFSLVLRRNHPLRSGGYARAGFIVLALGVVCFGAGAWQLLQQRPPTKELSLLSGQKPPVATSLPFLPASTNAPAEETGEKPALPTVEPTKASGELLDVRPTPLVNQIEQPGPTPTLTSGETDISHLLPTPTPSTLPDFPVPTPPTLASVGLDGGEPDNSSIKRLVIPLLGLDAIVKYVPFNGSTWLISGLKQEIAWMGDTSWPGLGSNTALAGHVDLVTGEKGPFWNLRVLKSGDEVQVYTEKKLYTYRVKDQTTVEDTDLTVIQPNEKPVVTLITCTGWDNDLRVYLKRLVVMAELIQVKPLTQSSN